MLRAFLTVPEPLLLLLLCFLLGLQRFLWAKAAEAQALLTVPDPSEPKLRAFFTPGVLSPVSLMGTTERLHLSQSSWHPQWLP